MTTSEQRSPVNKDHSNLIAKYLSIMVKHINHLQKDHLLIKSISFAGINAQNFMVLVYTTDPDHD